MRPRAAATPRTQPEPGLPGERACRRSRHGRAGRRRRTRTRTEPHTRTSGTRADRGRRPDAMKTSNEGAPSAPDHSRRPERRRAQSLGQALEGLLEGAHADELDAVRRPRGTLRAGRMQRVKPICAASRTRRPAWPAPRTSPARPDLAEDDRARRAAAGCGTTRPPPPPPRGRPPAPPPPARRPRSRTRRRRGAPGPRASRARPGAASCGSASRPMDMRRGLPNDGRRDEGLHLHQHGPRALERGHHRRARRARPAARTGTARRGWAPACRPVARHLEDAHLGDRRRSGSSPRARCGGAAASRPRSRGRCPRCARGTWARPGCRPW